MFLWALLASGLSQASIQQGALWTAQPSPAQDRLLAESPAAFKVPSVQLPRDLTPRAHSYSAWPPGSWL